MTGADPADRADIRGEIYHEWTGMNNFTPDTGVGDIIDSLENKEKEVALAYQKALQCQEKLREEYLTLISDQLSRIHRSIVLIVEHKEKPTERITIREEEKPFVVFRDSMFLETSVHSLPAELTER